MVAWFNLFFGAPKSDPFQRIKFQIISHQLIIITTLPRIYASSSSYRSLPAICSCYGNFMITVSSRISDKASVFLLFLMIMFWCIMIYYTLIPGLQGYVLLTDKSIDISAFTWGVCYSFLDCLLALVFCASRFLVSRK